MKKLITALALLCPFVSPAAAQSIGGNYTLEGTNLDGSLYDGWAETTREVKRATSSTEASGIGMCNDCSFAAGYVLNDQIGVVVYKVGARGTWSGLWAFANKIDDETEILTPVKQSWRG